MECEKIWYTTLLKSSSGFLALMDKERGVDSASNPFSIEQLLFAFLQAFPVPEHAILKHIIFSIRC
jgi:hypothetical protein